MIYKGIVIHRNEGPGSRMRYWAFTDKGQIVANTLSEMREMIREHQLKPKAN